MKASPSLNGVVIDKKLFTRLVKDKRQRAEDKEEISQLDLHMEAELAELKSVFVNKLSVLVSGKTSQGVKNDLNEDVIPKGTKFTLKALNAIEDYSRIVGGKWTTDDDRNDKIDTVIHNYKIKVNDIGNPTKIEKSITPISMKPKIAGSINSANTYFSSPGH